MTLEEKQLLLQDLCARLPYGVKLKIREWKILVELTIIKRSVLSGNYIINENYKLDDIKPYLRPMSSMTEEEKRELQSFFPGSFGGQWLNLEKGYIDIYECESTIRLYLYDATGLTEWLNRKMFDYRGFIDKDLAISTEVFNPYI